MLSLNIVFSTLLFTAECTFLQIGEEFRISANKASVICFNGSAYDWSFTDRLFSNVVLELANGNGDSLPFAMLKTDSLSPSCTTPSVFDSLHHWSLSLTNRNNTIHLIKGKVSCFIVCPSSTNEHDLVFVRIDLLPFNFYLCFLILISVVVIAFAPLIAHSKYFYYFLGALCGFGSFTILFFKISNNIRQTLKFRIEILLTFLGIFSIITVELLQHLYKLVLIGFILSLSFGASLTYLFIDRIVTPRTIRVAIFNIQLIGILIVIFSTDYFFFITNHFDIVYFLHAIAYKTTNN